MRTLSFVTDCQSHMQVVFGPTRSVSAKVHLVEFLLLIGEGHYSVSDEMFSLGRMSTSVYKANLL